MLIEAWQLASSTICCIAFARYRASAFISGCDKCQKHLAHCCLCVFLWCRTAGEAAKFEKAIEAAEAAEADEALPQVPSHCLSVFWHVSMLQRLWHSSLPLLACIRLAFLLTGQCPAIQCTLIDDSIALAPDKHAHSQQGWLLSAGRGHASEKPPGQWRQAWSGPL